MVRNDSAAHYRNTSRYSCGITTDGEAYCWGSNASGQLGVGSSTSHSDRPLGVAPR
jgi:alpha-tubulin suppressor-like RCC1 family protein